MARKSNFLDRTIGFFNPRAGAERIAYRQRMQILDGARGYEAASSGRLSKGWRGPGGDANAEIARAGQTLRDRTRDLERNNSLAAKIIGTHANNFVGAGIVPRAKTGKPETDKVINELFDDWSKVCHVDGSLDFYGLTYLLARMMVRDGDVFVRRRVRRIEDGLPVPLQLQLLDSEYCDWNKTGAVNDNQVINGIEFDKIGRRRGYWMHQQNPKSAFTIAGTRTSAFVPADSVAHIYEAQSNQVRGVPWLSPVIVDISNLTDYELAENVRKKLEACVVGIITPGDGADNDDPNIGIAETALADGDSDIPSIVDAYGNPFERMEPGMFGVMTGGKDVKFNTPAVSQGIEAYLRSRQRSIAAGVRLPYELMTGDFSQANFASGKLGLLEYQRLVGHIQWHILIPQVLQKIWDWFIEAAKLAGKIALNLDVKVEWTPPEFESITRLDDARADLLEVRMGKRSMPEIIAKTGRDPKTVLAESNEWWDEVDKTSAKLVFDSDPRKVAINGQFQQTSTNGEGDATGNQGSS